MVTKEDGGEGEGGLIHLVMSCLFSVTFMFLLQQHAEKGKSDFPKRPEPAA